MTVLHRLGVTALASVNWTQMTKAGRRNVLVGLSLILGPHIAEAAPCLVDAPPNEQPASSQSVPPEFCIAGAVGQHYYLWNIPANFTGKNWTLKLEALPGETARLLVQSLDHDPHAGFFTPTTIWSGANTGANAMIVTPVLGLKPGLYGVVVATQQPPGLFRLFVSSTTALAAAGAQPPAPVVAAAPTPATKGVVARTTPQAATNAPPVLAPAGPQADDANNGFQKAFAASAPGPVAGTLRFQKGSRDSQFIALTLGIDFANKRFDLVLRAKGRTESLDLVYVTPDGNDAETRTSAGEARIPRLSFAPGRYLFRVSAVPTSDMPYTLSVENVAPLAAGEEHEPDDSPALAQDIPANGTITGMGDGPLDDDFFRFHVAGPPKLYRVSCTCPGGDRLAVEAANGDELAQTREFSNKEGHLSSVLLGTGDHILRVRSAGPYTVHVEVQGDVPPEAGGKPAPVDAPLSKIDEIEPNDTMETAMPLLLDSSRGGVTDASLDVDQYRFTLLGPTHIRLTVTGPGANRRIVVNWGADQHRLADLHITKASGAPAVWEATLNAGDYYVAVSADDAVPTDHPYRVKLESLDPFGSGTVLPAEAHLKLTTEKVAAFLPDRQTVRGALTVTAKTATDVSLLGYAADERWHVQADKSNLHVDAGGTVNVPVTITIPPQALGSHPVQVAIALRNAAGAHVTASASIAPEVSASAVAPEADWDVPAQLAGGLDVAWSALGGKAPDNYAGLNDGLLNAGMVNVGGTARFNLADVKTGITISLAGNGPVSLAGFALAPAGSYAVDDRLRRFQIFVSADGTNFTPVLNGSLSPRLDTQYFVMPKPVMARVIRLVPLDAQDPTNSRATLAEFEAFANPASAPLGSDGLEIASILRGGHVVNLDPYVYSYGQSMLSARSRAATISLPPNRKEPASWVIGFLDDRPARIARIGWTYAPDQSADTAIPSVQVFGTMTNPNGPWTKLGDWELSPTGESKPFIPPNAPPVRFLKFVAAATKQGYGANLPFHMSIREIPVSPTYHSVLALPVHFPHAAAIAPQQQQGPGVLSLNKPVRGAVQIGSQTDHWMLTLPADTQSISLTLSNPPSLAASLVLKKGSGAAIPLAAEQIDGGTLRYSGPVTAGTYTVEVSEPPRSIALAWDTSASVASWMAAITASVRSIAQDASPGRDEINLFPFADPQAIPLLKSYSGDPATLFSTLQAYDWKAQSSGAEGAILGAVETLSHRPGRRGIILMTDADTTSASLTPDLWQALAKTNVVIFTLSVPTNQTGEDAWYTRNLMTDWAVATGGFNLMLGDESGAEAAFQRGAAALRSWASYSLTATVSTTPPPPPPPGTLAVSIAQASAKTAVPRMRGAVALLLDASGSMLQSIKGKKKIDIARNELDHLVRDILPDGTPTTLRVYGQGGSGSCRSDLMMPLAPLDRPKAEAIVAKVKSTDGAKTSTAASLHAVISDLAEAKGAKRIVLVTDGEENCGGNVESEISALKKSGFGVELDIVGFAIDAPKTGRTFAHWAQLGGGQYFEASDGSTLDTAMHAAVKEQFEAVDMSGKVVGSADVGAAPISLSAGRYTVRLRDTPADAMTVDIKPGAAAAAVLP
ncbi:MAG TPA: VWA domain-containing protein [Rhizomicrobium sp.]|nr:VWA domain-containing protein [Rhizomicrobium sp.]